MIGVPADRYRRQGPLTDPGTYSAALDRLPEDAGSLIEIVQGLMIHDASLHLYGLSIADFANASRSTRPRSPSDSRRHSRGIR